MDDRRIKVGDVRTAYLGPGFTRVAKVLAIDGDGLALVRYPDYPHLALDYVKVENLW